MSQKFVVTNQHGHYYSKRKAWTDGREPARVYCVKHHDEALNTLLEINAKDIDLRGQVVAVDLDKRDLPLLTISDVSLPEPEPEELEAAFQASTEPPQGESDTEIGRAHV